MSDYDTVRHFADSYGLAAMVAVFIVFVLWTFRPGARSHHEEAAIMIFVEDDDGETRSISKDESHG